MQTSKEVVIKPSHLWLAVCFVNATPHHPTATLPTTSLPGRFSHNPAHYPYPDLLRIVVALVRYGCGSGLSNV
ncbi:hypothetical protein F5Y08DRAFT_312008 [Xylaria arbuscula]|nr:hypothetical protein F5Y08DRAFT_312008 [Xylaria arbuscula]